MSNCKRKRQKIQDDAECETINETPLGSSRNVISCNLLNQSTQNVDNLPESSAQISLKKYFELNRVKIDEITIKTILRNLLRAIESKHSQKLVINNLSLDNITINEQSLELTLTAGSKSDNENDFIQDIVNFGLLIVSIFDNSCNNERFLQEIQEIQTYSQKVEFIFTKLKNAQWIQPENLQSLADLVVKCLHAEHQNYMTINSVTNLNYFVEAINNNNNVCFSKTNNAVTDKCTNLPSKFTLRKFIEQHKAEIDENAFKNILKNLLNELEIKHSHRVILNDITLDTVTITVEDNEAIPTLLNVPKTTETVTKKDYVKDIKDIGILVLSMLIDDKYIKNTVKEILELPDYGKKFDSALSKLNRVQWIQSRNLKLLTDLVVCLINVKSSNSPRAKEFKRHPYFWEDDKISKFIDKINSRLNLSTDGGSKDKVRKELVDLRKEVLEDQLPKNYDWKRRLGCKIKAFYPTDDSWSELIKFIRNRVRK